MSEAREIRIKLDALTEIVIDQHFLVDVIEDQLDERYETKVLEAVAEEILSSDIVEEIDQIEFVRRAVAVELFRQSMLDLDDYKRRV